MEPILPPVSPRDIGLILYRRRWAITLLLAGSLLGALAYLLVIREEVYAVSARLLVKIGREQAPPAAVMGASPQVIGYRTTEVNSEIEIFQSAQLLLKLIDDLGLDKPSPPPPVPAGLFPRFKYESKRLVKAVKDWKDNLLISAGLRPRLTQREKVLSTLQKGLAVKPAKDSNVFVAVLATPYRQGGAQVLNSLLDQYLHFRQQLYADGDLGFFQGEVATSLKDLRAAETQLQDFENTHDISLLAKQEETLIEQIARERSRLHDADLAQASTALRVRRLDDELRKPDPNLGAIGDFPGDTFQQNVLDQLADLQRERAKLLLIELDNSDRVQNNRQQFQALVAMLAANLRSSLADADATAAGLRATVARLESRLRDQHASTEQWNGLRRHVSAMEGSYTAYLKKYTEAKADGDMAHEQLSNVTIVERPVDPIQPAGIHKTTLLEITLLIALFAALAWVAIAEFLDHRTYSAADLEREIDAPVFAQIGGWH